jgi:hypothetical protein
VVVEELEWRVSAAEQWGRKRGEVSAARLIILIARARASVGDLAHAMPQYAACGKKKFARYFRASARAAKLFMHAKTEGLPGGAFLSIRWRCSHGMFLANMQIYRWWACQLGSHLQN